MYDIQKSLLGLMRCLLVDEFPPGLCVDCGINLPESMVRCSECTEAWSSFSAYLGRGRHVAVQPGIQELQDQGTVQLVLPEETNDA